MCSFASESALDLRALRSRLEAMDRAALVRFGQAAAYMCSPQANMGKQPREAFLLQLREAREKWRRRLTTSSQAHQIASQSDPAAAHGVLDPPGEIQGAAEKRG